VKRFLLALALAGAFAACKKAEPAPLYEKIAVQRRDIVVSASAAGSIQPILTVDVKSKASGQIIEMRVETGDAIIIDIQTFDGIEWKWSVATSAARAEQSTMHGFPLVQPTPL